MVFSTLGNSSVNRISDWPVDAALGKRTALSNLSTSFARSGWFTALILSFGVMLRVATWSANPPNNCLDDHLEPIAMYAINGWRPGPDKCWECYQPPLYYATSAVVLRITTGLTGNSAIGWKAVQAIGTIASIGILILTWKILTLWLPEQRAARSISLLTLAILPQDLYASGFIGNDELMVFFVTLAVTGYTLFVRSNHQWYSIILLVTGVIGAVWTKQSGAVSLILPGLILVSAAFRLSRIKMLEFLRPISPAVAVVLVLSIPAALADEMWRTRVTGHFLFSNQHVYNYTKDQEPGSLNLVSFTSFRAVELWKHPVMSKSTLASFWTELFARTWYDYEPRYLPETKALTWLARGLYLMGAVIFFIAIAGMLFFTIQNRKHFDFLPGLLLFIGFLSVPILQTYRFPYFSSMKAVFVLPAISIVAVFIAFGIQQIPFNFRAKICAMLAIALFLLGIGHTYAIFTLAEQNIATSTLPLWPIPAF